MQSIWLNLFWKEWCEHRWKLAALVAILFAGPLLLLAREPRAVPGAVMFSLMATMFLGPIYIAAGTAASERRRDTLAFLQALPVPMWKWAVVKLFVGLLTLWLPACAMLVFFQGLQAAGPWMGVDLAQVMDREFGVNKKGNTILLSWIFLMATSVFLWSVAAGVNRSNEIRAAGCAVAAIIGYWLAVSMPFIWYESELSWLAGGLLPLLFAMGPGGLYIGTQGHVVDVWTTWLIVPAPVAHTLLLAWFVYRYGRVADRVGRFSPSEAVPVLSEVTLKRPLSSPSASILWMQLRELAPFAAIFPLLIIGLGLAAAASSPESLDFMDRLRHALQSIVAVLGLLFATFMGAGVFLRDVEPNLNTFWRSRPVNPDLWFWLKYLSGLALLVLAMAIPAVLLLDPHPRLGLTPGWDAIAIAVCVGLAIYASAAAAMCLIRQPVYACLMSVGLVLTTLGVTLAKLDDSNFPDNGPAVVISLMAAMTVIFTLLAWLAIRYDWGWQSAD